MQKWRVREGARHPRHTEHGTWHGSHMKLMWATGPGRGQVAAACASAPASGLDMLKARPHSLNKLNNVVPPGPVDTCLYCHTARGLA